MLIRGKRNVLWLLFLTFNTVTFSALLALLIKAAVRHVIRLYEKWTSREHMSDSYATVQTVIYALQLRNHVTYSLL